MKSLITLQIVSTIDPKFFIKNMPEAFKNRKDDVNKKNIIQIDPFFANLI